MRWPLSSGILWAALAMLAAAIRVGNTLASTSTTEMAQAALKAARPRVQTFTAQEDPDDSRFPVEHSPRLWQIAVAQKRGRPGGNPENHHAVCRGQQPGALLRGRAVDRDLAILDRDS